MKMHEIKMVNETVKNNLSYFVGCKGNNEVVGLDGFTPEMMEWFDSLYDYETAQLISKGLVVLDEDY